MLTEWIYLILGILGLWCVTELLMKSTGIISDKLKISQSFIGLTILSIGTTLPELGTHIITSINVLKGHDLSGIALGANIGSNICQITLILGVTALFLTIYAKKEFIKRDYSIMLGSIALLFIFSLDNVITRTEGFILAALYLLYIYYLGKVEHFVLKVEKAKKNTRVINHFFLIMLYMALLLLLSDIVVSNMHNIAVGLGMADSMIAALLLGFGTALPEFTIAVAAIRHNMRELSIGVLVGSNITNPLFAVGIGALISTYSVDKAILFFDIPIWFIVSIVPLLFLIKGRINKIEAISLILLYAVYVYVRMMI
jgi:cation:H+ antiporter